MSTDRNNVGGAALEQERDPIMTNTRTEFYPHRHKLDGSFDSICLNCLATIFTSNNETELEAHEKEHVCHKFVSDDRLMKDSRLPF